MMPLCRVIPLLMLMLMLMLLLLLLVLPVEMATVRIRSINAVVMERIRHMRTLRTHTL